VENSHEATQVCGLFFLVHIFGYLWGPYQYWQAQWMRIFWQKAIVLLEGAVLFPHIAFILIAQ